MLSVAVVAGVVWVVSADGWQVNRLVVRIWWFLRPVLPAGTLPEDVDVGLNVAMMLVPALLGTLTFPRVRWWWFVLAGFVASLAIELTQYYWLDSRSAQVADVVANTAGALVGALSGRLLNRRRIT